MSPRHLLRVIGSVELATLALMLLNIATVHTPTVSRILGPVHGLAYTLTVLAAALVMRRRHRVWLIALVPGVGGLLAARVAASEPFATGADVDL